MSRRSIQRKITSKGFLNGWWRRSKPEKKQRNEYLETLSYQHRHFDVKGLTTQGLHTLELKEVFVNLRLSEQLTGLSAIQLLPLSSPTNQQTIWEVLTAEKWQEHNLVILGTPGSGKTTLLKHITLSICQGAALPAYIIVPQTPILLYLRDFADDIGQDPGFSLLTAVSHNQVQWQGATSFTWLQTELENGNCLILLDGLDEVADETARKKVVAWVEIQMAVYRQNRFIITSRPYGYQTNPFKETVVLEVRPFSPDQVRRFVSGWYLSNEVMSAQKNDRGVRIEARRHADNLLRRISQSPVLMELSINPLLLTMIATIHRYRGSLPDRRVDLFEEICEVFLGKRQQAKGLESDLIPAQKQHVLQPLAFGMMHQKTSELPLHEAVHIISPPLRRVSPQSRPDAFIRMIANSSGLLLEREPGKISFAHLTFQEYLAAAHIRENRLEREMVNVVTDDWWHETIRLFSAQGDATRIIRACVVRPSPSVPALTLALECLEEAQVLGPELRPLADRLTQSVENENPEVRRVGAEVLLSLRLRRMMRLDEGQYVDNSLVTQAEYQLFLDDVQASGHYHQPDHWTRQAFNSGQGREPTVGIRPSDANAFCEWLTEREGNDWLYRLPTADEYRQLTHLHQPETDKIGYWHRRDKEYRCTRPADTEDGATWLPQLLIQLEERFQDDLFVGNGAASSAKQHVIAFARQQIIERARQRSFTLLDLERELETAVPEVIQDWQHMRDRPNSTRAQRLNVTLEEAYARLESPDLDMARTIILADIIDVADNLAQSLPNTLKDSEQSEKRIGRLNRHLTHAREITQKQEWRLSRRDLTTHQRLLRHLGRALSEARKLVKGLKKSRQDARTRLRIVSLQKIIQYLVEMEKQALEDTGVSRRHKRQLGKYIDLYIDVLLLDERIKGNWPALEGIRIIRERR